MELLSFYRTFFNSHPPTTLTESPFSHPKTPATTNFSSPTTTTLKPSYGSQPSVLSPACQDATISPKLSFSTTTTAVSPPVPSLNTNSSQVLSDPFPSSPPSFTTVQPQTQLNVPIPSFSPYFEHIHDHELSPDDFESNDSTDSEISPLNDQDDFSADFTHLSSQDNDIFPEFYTPSPFSSRNIYEKAKDPVTVKLVYKTAQPQTLSLNALPFFPPEINNVHSEPNEQLEMPISTYDLPEMPQLQSLPHLHLQLLFGDTKIIDLFALYDQGCTDCFLGEHVFNAFPDHIKNGLEKCNHSLMVASGSSNSKLIGKIDLLIQLKSDPTDKHPILFKHKVYVATNVKDDFYVGSDLLGNPAFMYGANCEELFLKYPVDYKLPIDPLGPLVHKTIPFYFMNANHLGALTQQDLFLYPQETATISCSLTKDTFQNKFVVVENFTHECSLFGEFNTNPVPHVFPQETFVDDQNLISLSLTNYGSIPLIYPKGSLCAKVELAKYVFDSELNSMEFISTERLVESFRNEDIKPEFPLEIHNLSPNLEQSHDAQLRDFFVPQQKRLPKILSKSDFTEEQFLNMFDLTDVDTSTKEKLIPIFLKHRQAFSHFPMDIRKCTSYEHHIELAGQPQLPRARQFQNKTLSKVAEGIENLIDYKVMVRGPERKHYSNFVPVAKPNGKIRLCCDLILLNKVIKTTNKVARMGSPQQLFYRFFTMKKIWSVDLNNAYFHMPVSEFTKEYYGMYSYKLTQDSISFVRVIQGEKSAVWSWNSLMNKLFGNVSNIASWLDDILLYGMSDDELVEIFRTVVEIVDENGLSIAPSKVCVAATKLLFLGFIIDKVNRCKQIPEAKIQGLQNLPIPLNYTGLNSFLMSLTYFAEHLPGLAIYLHELRAAFREKKKFPTLRWTTERNEHFIRAKAMLSTAIVNYFPDLSPGAYFKLYCDASYFFYGMVLINVTSTGEERTVSLFSGEFHEKNLNWSMYMKEFYAVIYATNRYIHYILDYHVIVYTDCKALLYISEAKIDNSLTYRLAMYLSGFDLAFKHCKGVDNISDFMSRPYMSYLNTDKFKARKPAEIESKVNSMTVKSFYPPEEVKALLTHNFTEISHDQARINACKNKATKLFQTFKSEKHQIKAKCCSDCVIDLNHINDDLTDYPHPPPDCESSSSKSCQHTFEVNNFDIGHHIFQRFLNVPHSSLFTRNPANNSLSLLNTVPVDANVFQANVYETCSQFHFESHPQINAIFPRLPDGSTIPEDSDSLTPLVEPPNELVSKADTFKSIVFRDGVLTVDTFIQAQRDDAQIALIHRRLSSSQKLVRNLASNYELISGVVFKKTADGFKPRIYIPDFLVPYVLHVEHVRPMGIHRKATVLSKTIAEKYYFPCILDRCKEFVRKCRLCAYVTKDTHPPPPFGHSRQILLPLEHIVMDFAVSLPPSSEGYTNILIVMDAYSRYSMFYPMKSRAAHEILHAFTFAYSNPFQIPSFITADNEKSFHEGTFANYMKALGVMFKPLIPYRPNSAGKVEANVMRCKDALSTFQREFGSRKNWPHYLPLVTAGLNNSVHTSLGKTPHMALFGFDRQSHCFDILRVYQADEPTETDPDQYLFKRISRAVIDKHIQFHNDKSITSNSNHLNKHTKDRDFKVGDKVYRIRHRHTYQQGINTQLEGRYTGLYTVKNVGQYNLLLVDDATLQEVRESKAHCKPFENQSDDFKVPYSTFKEIDNFSKKTHPMKTRSQVQHSITQAK